MLTLIMTSMVILLAIGLDATSGFSPSSSLHRTWNRRGQGLCNDADANSIDNFIIGEDDDEDEDEDDCLPTPDAECGKMIFLISDGTGSVTKKSVQKSLGQFDADNVRTRLFNFVQGEEIAASIIKKAKERNAMVISSIRVRVLREKVLRICELEGVRAVDLIGPSMDGLESYLRKLPVNVPSMYDPGQVRVLSDSYYRRIDAIQFTLKADDGQAPWLLAEADVVLVGVSRSGKTPLSVTLSQSSGLRVANVPLVLECAPPEELLDEESIDPNRVFCLTVSPSHLKKIRETRLERRLGVKAMEAKQSLPEMAESKSNYADRAYILRDLKNAHELKEKYGWTQVDVTGRAVEDIASQICDMMKERFESTDDDKKSGSFAALN